MAPANTPSIVRQLQRVLLSFIAAATLGWLLAGPYRCEDAVVLGFLGAMTRGGWRSLAAVSVVILWWASSPAIEWPTYWLCSIPVVWLWRRPTRPKYAWVWESLAVGFAICWVTSPYLRTGLHQQAAISHGMASLAFGFQILVIAAALRILQGFSIAIIAPLMASLAWLGEIVRVQVLHWPCMHLALPAAATPVAQWAYYVGPFGVSFLVYLVNFLIWPDMLRAGLMRWLPSVLCVFCAAVAWLGGMWLERDAEVRPLSFSVVLVQPHTQSLPAAVTLDQLTRDTLSQGATPDLVVWPETAIGFSTEYLEKSGVSATTSKLGENRDSLSLAEFYQRLMPIYRTNCLVGAVMAGRDGWPYNSACLLTPEGALSRHDKLLLVPLVETTPTWVDSFSLGKVLPSSHSSLPLQPGREYRTLHFQTKSGRQASIGVAICYEMYFPWLQQYHADNKADAIIYLTNDSHLKDYNLFPGHPLWACQYRAIETRTWQLVCSNWTCSTLIDPRGRVRKLLPAEPGVLRVEAGFK